MTRSFSKNSGSRFSGGPVVALQRVRVRLARKGAAAAYTHLQQIDAVRRALQGAGWPVSTNQSKKPRPKVSFGPAISVGYESEAEYCDVELASRLDMTQAKENLEKNLPAGFTVMAIKSIPRFFPSLEQLANVARYAVVSPKLAGTRGKWEAFWSSESFLVTKKKADQNVVIDARPNARSWSLENDALELVLRFGPGHTLKPEKVAEAVCGWPEAPVEPGCLPPDVKVNRLQLFFEKENGELVEL